MANRAAASQVKLAITRIRKEISNAGIFLKDNGRWSSAVSQKTLLSAENAQKLLWMFRNLPKEEDKLSSIKAYVAVMFALRKKITGNSGLKNNNEETILINDNKPETLADVSAMIQEVNDLNAKFKARRTVGKGMPSKEDTEQIADQVYTKALLSGPNIPEGVDKIMMFLNHHGIDHALTRWGTARGITAIDPSVDTAAGKIPVSYGSLDWAVIGFLIVSAMTPENVLQLQSLKPGNRAVEQFFARIDMGHLFYDSAEDFDPPYCLSVHRAYNAFRVWMANVVINSGDGQVPWIGAATIGFMKPDIVAVSRVWRDLKTVVNATGTGDEYEAASSAHKVLRFAPINSSPFGSTVDLGSVKVKAGTPSYALTVEANPFEKEYDRAIYTGFDQWVISLPMPMPVSGYSTG